MGYSTPLSKQPWPTHDPEALHKDEITIVVQVNGKLRCRMDVAAHATKEEIEQKALADPNVLKHTQGKTIRKVIVIPEKLVNVVVQ
jgi:leucyl-tRNA synthetase